ncbi:MAG: rhomboid family intramembrane serine protease [bacterium]|nr:rhomboid family intramembrane serine protease [bacterium]
MDINVLTIILIITVIISLVALNNQQILDRYMFIPYEVKHHKRYDRFITHMFLHADIGHLAFNMFSLYFLGSMFLTQVGGTYYNPANGETFYLDGGLIYTYGQVMGQVHFIILYIAGGLFATIIPYARHQDHPHYKSLGASGAVSAVIFAAILWNPTMELQLLFIPIPIKAWLFGILYLGFEYYMDRRGGGRIAHDAHIGGALFGVLYVLIINIDKGKEFIQAIFG